MEKIKTYREFWPYYLSQHSRPWTRRLHVIGTLMGLGLAGYFAYKGEYLKILWGLVPGYGMAWLSHFTIEKNRPATWTYPLWSFFSDFRLLWHQLKR